MAGSGKLHLTVVLDGEGADELRAVIGRIVSFELQQKSDAWSEQIGDLQETVAGLIATLIEKGVLDKERRRQKRRRQ